MADIKVIIAEKDGVDLEYPEEYILLAEDMPFDSSSNGFTATKVQTAIEEAKSATFPDFVITDDVCLLFKEDGGFVLKG